MGERIHIYFKLKSSGRKFLSIKKKVKMMNFKSFLQSEILKLRIQVISKQIQDIKITQV